MTMMSRLTCDVLDPTYNVMPPPSDGDVYAVPTSTTSDPATASDVYSVLELGQDQPVAHKKSTQFEPQDAPGDYGAFDPDSERFQKYRD